MLKKGPGLAKVRSIPPLLTRQVRLVAAVEGHLRDWFDRADVVSEGAISAGNGDYYGTTSLLLPFEGSPFDLAIAGTWQALSGDPHLRLRALRVASREARGRGAIGPLRAELSIHRSARGLMISIDVEALASVRDEPEKPPRDGARRAR